MTMFPVPVFVDNLLLLIVPELTLLALIDDKPEPLPITLVASRLVPTTILPVVTIDSAAFVKLTILFITFPWLDACCNVTVPAVFDNRPPSPKKNLPELTVTLPDAC